MANDSSYMKSASFIDQLCTKSVPVAQTKDFSSWERLRSVPVWYDYIPKGTFLSRKEHFLYKRKVLFKLCRPKFGTEKLKMLIKLKIGYFIFFA